MKFLVSIVTLLWVITSCTQPKANFSYNGRVGQGSSVASEDIKDFGSAHIAEGVFDRFAAVSVSEVSAENKQNYQGLAGGSIDGLLSSVQVETVDRSGNKLGTPNAPIKVCLPWSGDYNISEVQVNIIDDITQEISVVPSEGLAVEGDKICVTSTVVNGAVFLSLSGVDPESISIVLVPPSSSIIAGDTTTFTIQAQSDGKVVTNYQRAVDLTYTGPGTIAAHVLLFEESNSGVHSFSQTFTVAGEYDLTFTDGIITSRATISVLAGPVAKLLVSNNPQLATLGEAITLTVSAVDSNNNRVSSYLGTVDFAVPSVISAPKSFVFDESDAGSKSISMTFVTVGDYPARFNDQADTQINNSGQTEERIVAALAELGVTLDSNQAINAANVATYSFTGSCNSSTGANIDIEVGGTTYMTTCSGGSWSRQADLSALSEGNVTVNLSISSSFGVGSSTKTLFKDTAPPVLSGLAADANPLETKTFNWTCDETCLIRVVADQVPATNLDALPFLANPSTFSQTSGVGTHYLHIQAQDSYGNNSALQHFSFVMVDTTNPTWASPGIAPATTTYLSTDSFTPTWVNPASDANPLTYHAKICTASNCTTACTGETVVDGSSTSISGFTPGTASFVCVEARDGSGNVSGFNPSAGALTLFGSLDHFVVSGVSDPVVAGVSSDMTVEAIDTNGNRLLNYVGTVSFSSSDVHGSVILPGATAFTSGDAGIKTFSSGVTLVTAGEQTITASDGGSNGTQSAITVTPASTVSLTVAGMTDPVVAGVSGSPTVTALDTYGNVDTNYTGTVTFTSSDGHGSVVLPGDYTFTGPDGGVRAFAGGVTLVTVGEQSLTATDTVTGTINGTQTAISVNAAPAVSLSVTGMTDPVAAGVSGSPTVTAIDSYGNVDINYTGTVSFTSSDGHGSVVLPGNYTFTGPDAGVRAFAGGVTLATAGEQSLTATDTVTGTINGTQTAISVNALSAVSLSVTGMTDPVVAGVSGSPTVTALDTYGNVDTNYTGTVAFTSSDGHGSVVLPGNYTFTGPDAGVRAFAGGVTLATAGEQSLTATDTVTGTINGTQTAITVNHASHSKFLVTGVADPIVAGVTSSLTVTAQDTYDNPVLNYLGTITFSSNSPKSQLPSDYDFSGAGGDGSHTFTLDGDGVAAFAVPGDYYIQVDEDGSDGENSGGSQTGQQTAITVQGHTLGEWKWIKGSAVANNNGNYGTINVTNSSDYPPARDQASLASDDAGNYYLFGGINAANERFNDLWKFDGTDWTWLKGSNTVDAVDNHGSKYVTTGTNIPGARFGSYMWVDSNNQVWIFGGGVGTATESYNDMWRYDGTDFTWVKGTSAQNSTYDLGSDEVLTLATDPRSTKQGGFSQLANGRMVLFAGWSEGDLHNYHFQFDGAHWRRTGTNGGIGGDTDFTGIDTLPGGSIGHGMFADDADRLILATLRQKIAGSESDSNAVFIYDRSQWNHIKGGTAGSETATVGTKGLAASGNNPSGRRDAATWRDQAGNLWLFGGVSDTVYNNDLWKFDGQNWTWIAGDQSTNLGGRYGSIGVGSLSSNPGSRGGNRVSQARNPVSKLWLFGGSGYDGAGTPVFGSLNDSWEFNPYAKITIGGDGSTYYGELSNRASAATRTKTLTIHNNSGFNFTGCSAPGSSDTTNYSIAADTCGTADLNNGATCTFNLISDPTTTGFLDTTITRLCSVGGPVTAWLTTKGQADLIVEAAYPNNGANWNDYVINNGGNVYTATDAACLGSETGGYAVGCVHGGEKRKVVVHGTASCAGLTISDNLGAFDWVCDATSGTATFFTSGLKSGQHLSNLLDGTNIGWKDNFVTVSGAATGSSASAKWWSNIVTLAPDNSSLEAITLDQEGTIYVIEGNRTSNGYHLAADKLGIVVMPGYTLTYAGSVNSNTNLTTGSTTTPDVRAFISSNKKFHWLEGKYDGEGGANDVEYGFLLVGSDFVRTNNWSIDNTTTSVLTLGTGSTNGQHTYGSFINSGAGITACADCSYQTFRHIKAAISTSNQINLEGDYAILDDFISGYGHPGFIIINTGDYAKLTNLQIANNITSVAINLSGDYTVVQNAFFTNHRFGILVNGIENKIVGVSSLNASNRGALHELGTRSSVLNILAINSATNGLESENSTNSTFAQLAFSSSTTSPIDVNNVNNAQFHGIIIADKACEQTNTPTNPGIGTDCQPTDSSTHTLAVADAAFEASIFGKITIDDTANTSDTTGAAAFPGTPATFDWFNFDRPNRLWGKDGSALPNADHIGMWTAGAGRIWDLNLKSTDPFILNRSGDGINANQAFVNGATCPSVIHGNDVITDQHSVPNVFLRVAMEVMYDGIGDDDALCESNEACIYSPNFGAYQGHGDYTTQTCTFQDGTVTGVTMYAYPNNGYVPPPENYDLVAGADSLGPGDGDDTFTDSGNEYDGSDVLDGGLGADELIIATNGAVLDSDITNIETITIADIGANISVTVTDASGITNIDASGVSGEIATVDAFQYEEALTILGGDGGNSIEGGKRDDTITGGNGADTIYGNYGDDTINAGSGDDHIYADSASFDPKAVANMTMWLRPGQEGGAYLTTSDKIVDLHDLSGNGLNLTQATDGDRPAFSRNGLAGRHVMTLDGASQDMSTASILGGDFASSNEIAVFYVNKVDAISATNFLSWSNGSGDFYIRDYWSDNEYYIGLADTDVANGRLQSAAVHTSFGTNWKVMSARRQSDGNVFVDANSVTQFSGTMSDVFPTGTSASFVLGANGGVNFSGRLAELLIYKNVPNDVNRQRIQEYLMFQYGQPHASHPYGTGDVLTGGSGVDTFYWTNASYSGPSNPDRISDFTSGTDFIDLTGFDETFYVLGLNGSFTSSSRTELLWEDDGSSNTHIKIDWGGDGTADFAVQLDDGFDTLLLSDLIFKNAIFTSGADAITKAYSNGATIVGGYNGDTLVGGAGADLIYPDGKVFHTTSVPDLSIWLDGANPNGNGVVPSDGASITTWKDLSGNGHDLAASGGNATYSKSDFDAQGGLVFNGTDSKYVSAALPDIADASVIFLVEGYVASPIVPNDTIFQFVGGSSNSSSYFNNSGEFGLNNYDGTDRIITDASFSAPDSLLGIANYNPSGASYELYRDGTSQGSQTSVALGAAPVLHVGSNNSSSRPLDGAIGEFLVYDDDLTATERVLVEEYVAMKYHHGLIGKSFGADSLTGGVGADQFFWTNASHSGVGSGNRDIITDFTSGTDQIVLDSDGPFLFQGTSAFSTVSGARQVRYTGSNPAIVEVDRTGDGVKDFEIELTGVSSLVAEDFKDHHITNGLVFHVDAKEAYKNQAFANGCTNSLIWQNISPSNKFAGTLTGFSACGATTGWIGAGSVADPYRLAFDGSDDVVSFGQPSELDFERTDSFSIELWIRADLDGQLSTLFGRQETGTERGYALEFGSLDRINFQLINDNSTNQLSVRETSSSFVNGQYYHVVASYDGSSSAAGVGLYINGALTPMTTQHDTLSATIQSATSVVSAGAGMDTAGTATHGDSDIIMIRVYNREISANEVKKNCQAEELEFTATRNGICAAP